MNSRLKLKPFVLSLLFVSGFFLISCQGGSSNNAPVPSSETTPPPPAILPPVIAAVPALSYETTKAFRFDWTDVGDATFYRLMEQADIGLGFSSVGSDIVQGVQTGELVVPLYARLNAQYILQSCNSGGCTDSAPISVSGTLVDSIGYIKASNSEANDEFGFSLSVSSDGSTLVVGAIYEDSLADGIDGDQSNNAGTNVGAAYVYSRSGSNWIQQAYVKASNSESNDLFGVSVSLSSNGDTLAVGAIGEDSNSNIIDGSETDNSTPSAGAVYVFSRSGSTWSQQAYVKASNSDPDDDFGRSVSLSADGNTLVVGAIGEESDANGIGGDQSDNSIAADAGAVYVYSRSGSTWSQQAYIKASNSGLTQNFGFAVSLSGDASTLAVGAFGEKSGADGIDGNQADTSASFSGAVYIFAFSGGVWSQEAYVKASNSEDSDRFGRSVSLSDDGNTLAAGANNERSADDGINGNQADNSALSAGAVYVFSRSGTTWSQQAYVKASNSEASDQFGRSVSLSGNGNTLAVGAIGEASAADGIGGDESDNTGTDTGATYVFSRSGSTWSQQAYVKASNSEGGDRFGLYVSLNSDGSLLAVGANVEASNADGIDGDQSNNLASDAGAVYIY